MNKDIYFNYDWKYKKEDIKYCPRCGEKFELMELIVPNKKYLVCNNCKFIYYLDPKLVVISLIVNEKNEVLLLKRNERPSKGLWGFPGGYVERGDNLYRAIKSEIVEETGLDAEIEGIIATHTLDNDETIQITFKAVSVNGIPKVNEESIDARFFSKEEIPWNSLAFETTKEILKLHYEIA